MDNRLTVAFEAHHPELNHHRRYEIAVGRDLFEDWTVVIRYGWVGQCAQERRYASPNPDELRAVIRDHLRRRLSAPKRIGCAYRLVALTTDADLDADAWLPAGLMAAFTP